MLRFKDAKQLQEIGEVPMEGELSEEFLRQSSHRGSNSLVPLSSDALGRIII